MEMGAGRPPRLELCGITKRFPGVVANDSVDLTVRPGEIHALLGENGAGKSTLVKILYGVLRPDAGEIRFEGRPVVIRSPHDARRLGIGMVFQHFTLFEALDVAENIALGLEWWPGRRELARRLAQLAERYGLELDLARTVHDLSAGERQRIEILRCLLQEPKLLVLDEPTSVLTPQEADRLFVTLRRLGLAVLPEERLGHAAVGAMDLVDNTLLTAWPQPGMVRHGTIRRRQVAALAATVVERFRVRTPGLEVPAAALSGGNLQRFVVGREIAQKPKVLVVDQPTWGVDAGAAAAIHRALVALAEEGAAVLLVSQDLDEILRFCDRVAVLYRGRLSAPMPVGEVTLERLGLLMGGAGFGTVRAETVS